MSVGCRVCRVKPSNVFPNHRPGKYLSLDCEMVGVGVDGTESSLARVSLVNFYGAIQLDVFVRQRERVVDYRTQFSGVRASDMIKGASTTPRILKRHQRNENSQAVRGGSETSCRSSERSNTRGACCLQ
jgi:hypothetical protein